MEENNHAKGMRCVTHIDRMKKDFDDMQGVRHVAPPQQRRPTETPSRPTEKLPQPERIPPSQPQHQTPQLRGPRATLPPPNQAATAPPIRHAIPSGRQTPPSPYVPPNQQKQESSGFLGSAVGFIA